MMFGVAMPITTYSINEYHKIPSLIQSAHEIMDIVTLILLCLEI